MGVQVPLLEWQRRYIADESRWKFLAAAVQTGKSFSASLEAVLQRVERRGLSIMLSASDRQSIELMQKVNMHAQAMGAAVETETGFFGETSIVQHTANFPNGSRIIGLPANPDTARGYSGDVYLDEFALHRDARAIWAAMVGRATRGYKVRVFSTFKGTSNKFYELAKMLGLHEGIRPAAQPVQVGPWSGHWVDIYIAREQGLKVDVEEIRAAVGDEEIFLQEYCNIPMSGAEEFIPLELVLACENEAATVVWDGEARPDLFAGMDIGRKRDLSVIWIVEAGPGDAPLLTRGVITLDRTPYAEQERIAGEVAAVVGRMSIDATGLGGMLAENLHSRYPWVEAVQFTAPVKERLAVELKRRFEERTILIPESPKIRRAAQSVKRLVSATGVMRFDAARSEAGHGDEFWALALAVAAASNKSYVPASEGGMVGRPVAAGMMEAVF